MKSHVPTDPKDLKGSLEAVLELVKFRNANDFKLTDYAVDPRQTEVVLTFE